MSLTSTLTMRIQATQTRLLDLGTATLPVDDREVYTWSSGTGNSQSDLIWTDTRTIAASGNEDLDLAGSLTDAFGSTLTFVELRAVKITASSANTNNVRVTRPASNGVPLFLAAGDGIDLPPGSTFMFACPTNGHIAVTAGTGDLLNIANSGSGTGVTYDIEIIGASA